VARKAVDEVVLAAVRLVGDHDDVAPLGEDRVAVALLLRQELLDRREHHAARRHRELQAQIGAVGGLHRRLAQQVAAAREGAEELIVEVVAVGQHDQRRASSPGAGRRRHGQVAGTIPRARLEANLELPAGCPDRPKRRNTPATPSILATTRLRPTVTHRQLGKPVLQVRTLWRLLMRRQPSATLG